MFASAGEAVGKLELPIVIEPHDGSQFSLSSLALSHEVRRTSQAGAEIEASLLQDRTPLIGQDLQVVPSGSNVFRHGEPAMFYFELYEPRPAHPDPKQATLVGIQIGFRSANRRDETRFGRNAARRSHQSRGPRNPARIEDPDPGAGFRALHPRTHGRRHGGPACPAHGGF